MIRHLLIAASALACVAASSAAAAQSSASTYSYGTYNPVQAAINRNSMNAAILKQAGKSRHAVATHAVKRTAKPHR